MKLAIHVPGISMWSTENILAVSAGGDTDQIGEQWPSLANITNWVDFFFHLFIA